MNIDKIIQANGGLYRTTIPGTSISFTYRLLSLKEYKVYKSLRDGGVLPPLIINELVFERCYIGDKHLIDKGIPAGATVSIGGMIMFLSGDSDSETLAQDIKAMRQANPENTVFEYMRTAIVTAFPTTTIDQIESSTRPSFIKTFVIAENVLSKQNSEYSKLNLSEIKTQEELEATSRTNIDFSQENRAIKSAMGYWNNQEAEQRFSEERSRTALTKKQLSKLDSRR